MHVQANLFSYASDFFYSTWRGDSYYATKCLPHINLIKQTNKKAYKNMTCKYDMQLVCLVIETQNNATTIKNLNNCTCKHAKALEVPLGYHLPTSKPPQIPNKNC